MKRVKGVNFEQAWASFDARLIFRPRPRQTATLDQFFSPVEDGSPTRRGHMPLMLGRSMEASSLMPIPLRMILNDPSLKQPEQVTNCPWPCGRKPLRLKIRIHAIEWPLNLENSIFQTLPNKIFAPGLAAGYKYNVAKSVPWANYPSRHCQ